MATAPRIKALPTAHELTFIDTLRKIRQEHLVKSEDIPMMSKHLHEIAEALLKARTDFDEPTFWNVYESLSNNNEKLREWKDAVLTGSEALEIQDPHFVASEGKRLLKLSTIEDIYNLPDALPLIAGILEAGSVSMLYGLSGTGKTFTALDLALCICHGRYWHGRKVEQGNVWYVNTEGGRGLKKRLQAWYKEHDHLLPDLEHFKIIPWSLDLRVHQAEMINTIDDQEEPPALLIIDNFSMCAPGVDQNKQEQVAPILGLLNALAAEYNTHIMVVHHTNKSGDVNGTMAFRNHVDTMIELVKEDAADRDSSILFRCMKARDSEPFRDIRTELKSIVLYTDPETLETITSCVVTTSATPEREKGNELKDVEQNIFDILGERSLTNTEWQKECISDLKISERTFSRALKVLNNKALIKKIPIPGRRFEGYQQTPQDQPEAWNE